MNPLDPSLELQRVVALHESGLLTSPDLPELDEICRLARERFGVATALVTLIDHDIQVIKAPKDSDLKQTPRSQAFCDHTIRSDQVFVVPDARLDPRFATNPFVTGEPFIRFYAGAPLIYLHNIRLGALCLLDGHARTPEALTRGDRAELETLAEAAVSVIVQKAMPGVSHLGPRQTWGQELE